MILANIAWILASNGKKVLVIDWDLEAPGLHYYFRPFLTDKDLVSSKGLIDLLIDFMDLAHAPYVSTDKQEDKNSWWEKNLIWRMEDYIVQLKHKSLKKGMIDFLPAGKQGSTYPRKVNSFSWDVFYEKVRGSNFIEAMKKKIRNEYDYVLIDSRTGVNDTAGICTIQMPDILVVLFTGNNQSILGARNIARTVEKQWQYDDEKDSKNNERIIFPVLSRIDSTEKDKLGLARQYIKIKFSHFLRHLKSETEIEHYWQNAGILYIPWYAYEEVLATFDETLEYKDSLLKAIEPLVGYLTAGEVTKLVPPSQAERKKIISEFNRQFSKKSYDAFLLYSKEDSNAVKEIATYLVNEAHLKIWFDEWTLNEGEPRKQNLTEGLERSLICVVFIGNSEYPWQDYDVEDILQEQIETQGLEIIPVLLPNATKPKLPAFIPDSTLLEFKQVLDKEALLSLGQQLTPIQDTPLTPLVFINAAVADMPLAHQIKDYLLNEHGIGCAFPLEVSEYTTPVEIRQFFEQMLLDCDAVILVYDKVPATWIEEQLLYCRRMQGQRQQPFKTIAIYVSKLDKPSPSIFLPNMQILECSTLHTNTCLPKFIRALQ